VLDFEHDGEEQEKLRREGVTIDDYSIPGAARMIWCKTGQVVDWWPLAGGVLYSYHPWTWKQGSSRWSDVYVLRYGWFYDTSTWRDGFSTPLGALLSYIARGVEDGDEIGTEGMEALTKIQEMSGILA